MFLQLKRVAIELLLIQLIGFSSSLNIPEKSAGAENGPTWTNHIVLRGGFEVKWRFDDTWVTMEMSAPTKGYLGIGFSPNGGMTGSDMGIGWVDDDGTPHLKDYYGTKNGAPTEDPHQDYELIDAKEDDSGTKIVFRRKWDTCDDQHDRVLTGDTTKLIWAMHAEDPKETLQWHGSTRGVKFVFLKSLGKLDPKGFPDDAETPHPDIKHFDVTLSNFSVPHKDSYYQCKIFRLPKLNTKHHIIGYRPVIPADRVNNVHHIVVLRCLVPEQFGTVDELFDKYVGDEGKECFVPGTPREWDKFCFTFVVAHGIGAEGGFFPDHLGYPVGEVESDNVYLRLDIHYENPEKLDLIDSSGIRIFYTPKLREYDTAMMFAGHRRTPFLSIPPLQKSFEISGYCPGECTEIGVPKDGIKFFSIQLHAHYAGKKLTLRHIRDGKELPMIAQDNSFDFNYQEHRILPKEILFLPGDELIMECGFDTSDRPDFILGGLTSKNEMCEAFIYYYPKASLVDCRGQPELHSFLESMNIKNVSGELLDKLHLPYDPALLPPKLQDYTIYDDSFVMSNGQSNASSLADTFNTIEIDGPKELKGQHILDYMISLDWSNEDFVRKIEHQWRNGPRYAHCSAPRGRRIKQKHHISSIPKYEPLVVEQVERKCTLNE